MGFKALPSGKGQLRESEILSACLQWLAVTGWKCWRNNTGGRPWTDARGKRRLMRFGAKGSGDVFALRNGVFLTLETKRVGKEPTLEQEAWAEDVRSHGGVALLVHSLQELIDGLEVLE